MDLQSKQNKAKHNDKDTNYTKNHYPQYHHGDSVVGKSSESEIVILSQPIPMRTRGEYSSSTTKTSCMVTEGEPTPLEDRDEVEVK